MPVTFFWRGTCLSQVQMISSIWDVYVVSYRRDEGVFNWTEKEEGERRLVCHIEVIFSFLKGGGYPYI